LTGFGRGGATFAPDTPLQKLPGQHQLLGWHLDRDAVRLLARVGAEIDADEYG
jgi:hypothetical protein